MNYFNASDSEESTLRMRRREYRRLYQSDSTAVSAIDNIRRSLRNIPAIDPLLSEVIDSLWNKDSLEDFIKKSVVNLNLNLDTTSTGLSRYEILRNNTQEI